jgi:hypothetical protein
LICTKYQNVDIAEALVVTDGRIESLHHLIDPAIAEPATPEFPSAFFHHSVRRFRLKGIEITTQSARSLTVAKVFSKVASTAGESCYGIKYHDFSLIFCLEPLFFLGIDNNIS